MKPFADRLRTRLAAEDGISIVEVVVAALILVIVGLGVLSMGDAATRNTYRAEQSQVLANRLQAELEHIRQLPYGEVALTAAPATSSSPTSPANRVSGGTFALNRDGSDPKPLLYNGGTTPGGAPIASGALVSGPEDFTSGDVHGQIYRYVVAPGAPANCVDCTGDDLKRVIIAIELDPTGSGGTRTYQEIQSEISDPEKLSKDGLPGGGGPGGDTIATFWLTDTPCNQTARQGLTGNHASHNTRGVCADGVRTGSTKGSPDLMFNEQPPDQDAGDGTLYDYATDVEPVVNPNADIGLNLIKPTTNSCLLNAPLLSQLDFPVLSSETNKQLKTHIWLSNPLNTGFKLLTAADASLQLWTKAINEASYSGKICIWVFKRVTALNLLGQTITVDVPAVNLDPPLVNAAYFAYSKATWPTSWTEIAVPMRFIWATDALSGLNIVGQPRLGLAIQVERAGTSGSGLEFMYDHPSFESRLEVQSSTSILP